MYMYRAYACVLFNVHKILVKRRISILCPSFLLYFIFRDQNLPFLHHKLAVSKYENYNIPSSDTFLSLSQTVLFICVITCSKSIVVEILISLKKYTILTEPFWPLCFSGMVVFSLAIRLVFITQTSHICTEHVKGVNTQVHLSWIFCNSSHIVFILQGILHLEKQES